MAVDKITVERKLWNNVSDGYAMKDEPVQFTEAQKERIDRLLLESLHSFERGEGVTLRPSEIEEMVEGMIRLHQGKQREKTTDHAQM